MTCSTCGKIKEQHGMFSDHEYECDMMETVSIGSGLSAQSVGAKKVVETIIPCSCFDSIHKALLRETGMEEGGPGSGRKKGDDGLGGVGFGSESDRSNADSYKTGVGLRGEDLDRMETDKDPTGYSDSKGNQSKWRGDFKTRRLGKKSKGTDEAGTPEGAKKGWDKRGRGRNDTGSVGGFEKKGGSFGVGAEPLNINRDEFGTPIDPSGQDDYFSGGKDLSPYEQNQLGSSRPDYTAQRGDQQQDFDDPTQNPERYDAQFSVANKYLQKLEGKNQGVSSMGDAPDTFVGLSAIRNEMVNFGLHPDVVKDAMITWGADPSYFDIPDPDWSKPDDDDADNAMIDSDRGIDDARARLDAQGTHPYDPTPYVSKRPKNAGQKYPDSPQYWGLEDDDPSDFENPSGTSNF